ncbi:hypothetical protein E3N88_19946 [Mikania micrantha]|uniref:Uncharacterized protein n=1 Tax=Mikania micrantha TaxID=192012 RepID=A0A5N6NI88_9ASTR|nr:hypothetical protein E3N88_19946 [Mikania micrantha]
MRTTVSGVRIPPRPQPAQKGRAFPSGAPGLWNKGVSRTYTGVLTVIFKSPQVGFEPTTNRLTADRSTTELLRNNGRFDLIEFHSRSQPMTNMSSKLPSPIAVRDGQLIGPSRYATLERENLNSPKSIAVRDDRSSSTIAVRGVFREPNDYFNHRATRSYFLGSRRARPRHHHHLERPVAAVEAIPWPLANYSPLFQEDQDSQEALEVMTTCITTTSLVTKFWGKNVLLNDFATDLKVS